MDSFCHIASLFTKQPVDENIVYVPLSDEVGPRIGEALSIRLKDMTLDGNDVLCRSLVGMNTSVSGSSLRRMGES